MSLIDFHSQLKTAHRDVSHAIDLLNDALATSESRLLEPKHRHLLHTTRNNLKRQSRVLLHLTQLAMELAYQTHRFPSIQYDTPILRSLHPEPPSPHKPQAPNPDQPGS